MPADQPEPPTPARIVKKVRFFGTHTLIQFPGLVLPVAGIYLGVHIAHGRPLADVDIDLIILGWSLAGVVGGLTLLWIGSREATRYFCGACGYMLTHARSEACPACGCTLR